ncbi:MAG: 4a-hydroxytetrahydrobiopterin dehydratase [Vampirovibrionales bacterium]
MVSVPAMAFECLDSGLIPMVESLSHQGWQYLGVCHPEGQTMVEPTKMYLEKTFRFPTFVDAVAFVNALTPLAENAGHHPDLVVGWGRVVVQLSTHDAGHRVTLKDVALAQAFDHLVP